MDALKQIIYHEKVCDFLGRHYYAAHTLPLARARLNVVCSARVECDLTEAICKHSLPSPAPTNDLGFDSDIVLSERSFRLPI